MAKTTKAKKKLRRTDKDHGARQKLSDIKLKTKVKLLK